MRSASTLLALAMILEPSFALAQPSLRSTFPGRRVGGGTRGECSARMVAHLVPPSSVFAPVGGLVGVLEGPTVHPRPLVINLREVNAVGSRDAARSLTAHRELPAASAGVTLLVLPFKAASVWESSYRCDDGPDDPTTMVSAEVPPVVSLLLTDVTSVDRVTQTHLLDLRALCGRTVSRGQLATSFDLAEVISGDWPPQLPVRCPN